MNFREPARRSISCLYYRFEKYLKKRGKQCLATMPKEDFTELIARGVDLLGFPCLNEPYHAFTGSKDRKLIQSLGIDYNRETKKVKARFNYADAVFHHHVSECDAVLPYRHGALTEWRGSESHVTSSGAGEGI